MGTGFNILLVSCTMVYDASKKLKPVPKAEFKKPIVDSYEHQGHPYYASARLWDDGVIDPAQTREVVALSLSATLNRPAKPTRFGVFRM